MKKQTPTYEEAMARLESIAASLEDNELGLNNLADRLREAQQLIAQCKELLIKTEADINEILSDDGTR